jgi:predicted RNA-binding protein with PIN domain
VIGVFPGSFDPPTIAHVGIAEAALRFAGLERVDFALSRAALGKESRNDVEERRRALQRIIGMRRDLDVIVTDAQLITDIAQGYDAVVMGADKWAQVNDPEWYRSHLDRDRAVAALPRVLVVPRPGFDTHGAEMLPIGEELAPVSSTAARDGAAHFVARAARRRLIVDGMNVIGARPDGWWRDRAGASRRLIASLHELAQRVDDQIAVVLDGRPLAQYPEGVHGGVLVAYASRQGRDAADDRIVDEVRKDRDPASLTVVTSDKGLRARVEALGARTETVSQLLSAMEPERR